MRLIYAEEVIKSLMDFTNGKKTIGQCIDDTPTASIEPRTGRWIEGEIWEDTDGGWGRWQKCSVCRESKHHKTNYCPNCGAKMVEPQESEVNNG